MVIKLKSSSVNSGDKEYYVDTKYITSIMGPEHVERAVYQIGSIHEFFFTINSINTKAINIVVESFWNPFIADGNYSKEDIDAKVSRSKALCEIEYDKFVKTYLSDKL